ncbi:hypothetical protein DPMN_086443 [Dreissena polymorpha]|uniref:Uncharacterized protein n=2 Tax=Dreissena polymorpha TaxID=45954 RepID=A0A9D4KR69_DREPO|nr:hypothetical protein DPMN_086443 [Dreissena polymorpha]
MSEHPVWIVLNSADPLPALPCIEQIYLRDVTCSSRGLRGLLSSLLTLDHEVECSLVDCSMTSIVQKTRADMKVLNNTLEMVVDEDSPGLWEALHSLNIKSLSLERILAVPMRVKHGELLSQSLLSLTQLETLSIQVFSDIPGLWEALHSLNIKSLSLKGPFRVRHGELSSQSLSSFTQLETLTMHLDKYIVIQPLQSLKYLNIYCNTLLPYQLRELIDTLRACTQTIDSRLEFGCALLTYADDNHDKKRIRQIAPEEYIPIVQELETLENVAVNRFEILDRTRANTWNVIDTCWSARSNGDIDDDKQNGDNVKDYLYTKFVRWLDDEIIHRISMRLQITPGIFYRNFCM